MWHTAGVQTIEEARKKEISSPPPTGRHHLHLSRACSTSCSAPGSRSSSGYQGNSTMTIAMERGEVRRGDEFLGQLEIVQSGMGARTRRSRSWCRPSRRRRTCTMSPRSQELRRNEDDRKVIELIISGDCARQAAGDRAQRAGRAREGAARRVRCHDQGPGVPRGRDRGARSRSIRSTDRSCSARWQRSWQRRRISIRRAKASLSRNKQPRMPCTSRPPAPSKVSSFWT